MGGGRTDEMLEALTRIRLLTRGQEIQTRTPMTDAVLINETANGGVPWPSLENVQTIRMQSLRIKYCPVQTTEI